LSDRDIKVRLSEDAVDLLIEKGFDRKMGARPLARTINDLIKVPLSKKILFEQLANGTIINIKSVDKALTFEVINANITLQIEGTPSVDENGFIRLD
jgi:ATP-dependent Clp protease ATP-binding subunit ClpA